MTVCEDMRTKIQERLDGPVDADAAQGLEEHLRDCAECREYERGLLATRRALRELPELEFPDDALEEVWKRTVRCDPAPKVAPWVRRWQGWTAAAAVAAAMGLALLLNGFRPATGPDPMSPEEAARQARLALGLAAEALRRSERVAIDDVLAGEVSPALGRIPVRLPGSAPDARSNGT